MSAKLSQMDKLVRDIIDLLDENTLLVVMGDHGMDTQGNHGGESWDELQAALFMYSKRKHFGYTSPQSMIPPRTARSMAVNQIDLVPTLALMLGLPIPFNNLGSLSKRHFWV
ncbi:hypothetical protein MRB53_037134 [Persea americana]|nr:hypothetical protein MRB53_037134 [Persea americana]